MTRDVPRPATPSSAAGRLGGPRRLAARGAGTALVVHPPGGLGATRNTGAARPPAHPIRLPALVGAAPDEISDRVSHLELWLLVDQSGSVFADFGDPSNTRAAAVSSLLKLLVGAQTGTPTPGVTGGLVQWGSSAPRQRAVAAVGLASGRGTIDAALAQAANLGGTDLTAGVMTALELMQPLDPGRRRLTLVISDGIQTVDTAVRFALSDPALGAAHMLLIDRSGGCSTDMELEWQSCQLESVTRITTFTTRAIAHEMAALVARELALELDRDPIARQAAPWKRRSWWRQRQVL